MEWCLILVHFSIHLPDEPAKLVKRGVKENKVLSRIQARAYGPFHRKNRESVFQADVCVVEQWDPAM